MGLEEEQTGRRLNKIPKYLTRSFWHRQKPPLRAELTFYKKWQDAATILILTEVQRIFSVNCVMNILYHEYIKIRTEIIFV